MILIAFAVQRVTIIHIMIFCTLLSRYKGFIVAYSIYYNQVLTVGEK